MSVFTKLLLVDSLLAACLLFQLAASLFFFFDATKCGLISVIRSPKHAAQRNTHFRDRLPVPCRYMNQKMLSSFKAFSKGWLKEKAFHPSHVAPRSKIQIQSIQFQTIAKHSFISPCHSFNNSIYFPKNAIFYEKIMGAWLNYYQERWSELCFHINLISHVIILTPFT